MPKRVTSLVIAVSAAFPIALIALSIICPALAGTECIEQPTPKPSAGSHWYYTSDSVKNRKCWFLTVAGAKRARSRGAAGAVKRGSDANNLFVVGLRRIEGDQSPGGITRFPATRAASHPGKPRQNAEGCWNRSEREGRRC